MTTDSGSRQAVTVQIDTTIPDCAEGATRTWDDILKEGVATEDDVPSLRAALPRAVEILRKELGDLDGPGSVRDDPRYWWVHLNEAPWTRHRLVWLADCIQRNRRFRTFDRLARRLRHPIRFFEALDVIEVSDVLERAGLGVEFDPTIHVENKDRTPDLLVKSADGSEELFIEVTTSRPSDSQRHASHVMHVLVNALMEQNPLVYRGRCLAMPNTDDLRLLTAAIAECAERARTTQSIAETEVPGLMELVMAPREREADLLPWATRWCLESWSFQLPDVDTKEVARMTNCIRDKAKRIPSDRPSAVFVNNGRILHHKPLGKDALGDRVWMRQLLEEYPQILCVAFCTEIYTGGTFEFGTVLRPAWNTVASRMAFPGRRMDYEIVWNASFRLRRPASIIRSLYRELLQRHLHWARLGHECWSYDPT